MTRKLHIGILFGGKSTEHEVSIRSARSVIDAIDKNKYDITTIGVDQQGQWHLCKNSNSLTIHHNPSTPMALLLKQDTEASKLIELSLKSLEQPLSRKIDVIFPILHGIYGEDGAIQGLLKLANIPCVGAGILGSAIGMDKDVMKRLLRDAGIQIPKFLVFRHHEQQKIDFHTIKNQLGLPFFVKPANTGSSVGINKILFESEFESAITEAFTYDNKILIEEYIAGQEIECAVLGNDTPIASILGEIIPHHEFYSYEAKYLDENGATLKIPAGIPEKLVPRFQQLAIDAFKTLCCHGMARVDFFLRQDGEIFVNEINTIPGFTSISMYPQLWQASGLSYSSLIDRLIELALEEFQQREKLNTQFLTRT